MAKGPFDISFSFADEDWKTIADWKTAKQFTDPPDALPPHVCPVCRVEATHVSNHMDLAEIQTIGGGPVKFKPGMTTVVYECPNHHNWQGKPIPPPPPPPPPPWTGSNRVWLEGEVEANFDDYRIGGKDLFEELHLAFDFRYGTPTPEVKVMLGIDPQPAIGEVDHHEGKLDVASGFHGSEVTPPEMPEVIIGNWNLLAKLDDYDGRRVALLVELKEE